MITDQDVEETVSELERLFSSNRAYLSEAIRSIVNRLRYRCNEAAQANPGIIDLMAAGTMSVEEAEATIQGITPPAAASHAVAGETAQATPSKTPAMTRLLGDSLLSLSDCPGDPIGQLRERSGGNAVFCTVCGAEWLDGKCPHATIHPAPQGNGFLWHHEPVPEPVELCGNCSAPIVNGHCPNWVQVTTRDKSTGDEYTIWEHA